jgi:hypothetical protein
MAIDQRGFIYVAVNKTADSMAEKSAASLRAHHPDARITLFTDQPNISGVFNRIVKIPSTARENDYLAKRPQYPDQGMIAKLKYMAQSPYPYTVFLDIDTYICGDLSVLFDVLSDTPGYDCAACIDEAYVMASARFGDIPCCVPRFNTGVVAFRNNDTMADLFTKAFSYMADPQKGITANDEPAFSAAAYRSNARILTLPPEYNCRFIFPYILRAKAVVLHGRPESADYDILAKKINKSVGTYRVMHIGDTLATHEPNKGFRRW